MFAGLMSPYDLDVFLLKKIKKTSKKKFAAQKTNFPPKNHIFSIFCQKQ